jgi:hypothetical protein
VTARRDGGFHFVLIPSGIMTWIVVAARLGLGGARVAGG